MIKKRITAFILCFVLAFVVGGGIFFSAFTVRASAELNKYTNVLEDLSSLSNFSITDYPTLSGDYSLQFLTLAESDDQELFVYLYQPGGSETGVKASSINISTVIRGTDQFFNYPLNYINSDGVFFKYKVNNFIVSDDTQRYYEIPSIFRAYVKDVDGAPSGDNTIFETAFSVGKCFTFITENGHVSSTMDDVEYVYVTDKFCGFIRYQDSFPIFTDSGGTDGVDAHFVAFSTDYKIDELLEADVVYEQSDYHYKNYGAYTDYGWSSPKSDTSYLVYGENPGIWETGVFLKKEHMWERIQKTSDFINKNSGSGKGFLLESFSNHNYIEFNTEAEKNISNCQWILFFAETKYVDGVVNGYPLKEYSSVGKVSLLRLKFISSGTVYDLGVVDNKQSGSSNPSGIYEENDSKIFDKILAICLLILLVVVVTNVFFPLIKPLVKILINGIFAIVSICFNILTLPIRLLFKSK